jgi:hypothetical protein
VEVDKQGERFRILEPAVAPEGPKAPNRPRLLMLGLLLAFAAAAASVVIAEQLDSTIHTVDELRGFTAIPVLATIPAISHASNRRRMRLAFAMVSALAVIGIAGAVSAHVARGNEQLVRILVRTS